MADPVVEKALSNGDEGSLSASLTANLEMGALGKLLFDVKQIERRNELTYWVKSQTEDEDNDYSMNESRTMLESMLLKCPETMNICAVPMVGLYLRILTSFSDLLSCYLQPSFI